MEPDIIVVVPYFFHGTPLPRFYLASFIVLILKVLMPTRFDKFRPISLCSVIYKVCSKILVQRLFSILGQLVSLE